MQVWMEMVSLASSLKTQCTPQDRYQATAAYTSLCPSPQYFLLAVLLLLCIGHVGGDADLGIALRHLRMLIHGYFWHYPT